MQIYDNVSDILNGNNSYLFESCAKNNCFPNAGSNWFKCHLPDCDYSTLFENRFNDHIKDHVSYRLDQEIPEYCEPFFNDSKAERKLNSKI